MPVLNELAKIKEQNKTINLNVKFQESLNNKLEEMAKELGTTRSELVRIMVKDGIEQYYELKNKAED